MGKLPNEIKLTIHARNRLEERKNPDNRYNTKNLMKSSCKWYTKDDFIENSKLYLHCLYVCRKSNQMGYITDGNIEVIYNKSTGVAITVIEVKEKFLPITKYIKPEVLKQIQIKKEIKKMRKASTHIDTCPDCGEKNVLITSQGICAVCRTRKTNAKNRGREYIPYLQLPEEKKHKIDALRNAQINKKLTKQEESELKEIPIPEIPIIENYYQVKAEQNPAIAHVVEKHSIPKIETSVIPDMKEKVTRDPMSDPVGFITTLRECGCEIPGDTLKDVLDVLVATDKLKDIITVITKGDSQQAILDLEQALNVVERKLQHNWEYNGFQEADDIKFKDFLTWRRVLKGAIFFWKKLYQTNTLIELQKAWNSYTQDPTEKTLLSGDRISSIQKRYQITTESISTIFNTRRPFTRVFYATDKDSAYNMFKQWMADRNLHEDPKKTTIIELQNDGSEDGRK